MSNIIPPLLSSSPPPIIDTLDEEEDDEFGDFRAATDSYDCDELSVPSSIENSPDKELKPFEIEVNDTNESIKKDFQDKRKSISDENSNVNSNTDFINNISLLINEDSKEKGCVNEKELNGIDDDILLNSKNNSHLIVVETNFNQSIGNETNLLENLNNDSQSNVLTTQLDSSINCSIREENETISPSTSNNLTLNDVVTENSDFENYSGKLHNDQTIVLESDNSFKTNQIVDEAFNDFQNHSIIQDWQETVSDYHKFETKVVEESYDDFRNHSTNPYFQESDEEKKFDTEVAEKTFYNLQNHASIPNCQETVLDCHKNETEIDEKDFKNCSTNPDFHKTATEQKFDTELIEDTFDELQNHITTTNCQETVLDYHKNESKIDEENFSDFQNHSINQNCQKVFVDKKFNINITEDYFEDSQDSSETVNLQETVPNFHKFETKVDENNFHDFPTSTQEYQEIVLDDKLNTKTDEENLNDFQDFSITAQETVLDFHKFETKLDEESFDDFQSHSLTQPIQKNILDDRLVDKENLEDVRDYSTVQESVPDNTNTFVDKKIDSGTNLQSNSKTEDSINETIVDNDDDDFGDFETAITAEQESVTIHDDFGEFVEANFDLNPVNLLDFNSTNIFAKTEEILKEVFLIDNNNYQDDFENFETTKNNFLFCKLKDLTETDALNYQWSKSTSQKLFLKALNIDTRNILHGPAWNPLVPRFAANLSVAPLEPIKSDLIIQNSNNSSSNIQNSTSLPSNSSQINNQSNINIEIPTAQFDWSDSGLINPLDYLEQLAVNLDILNVTNSNNISKSNQSNSPISDEIDDWDVWLQSSVDTVVANEIPEPIKSSEKSLDSIFVSKIEENDRHLSNNFEFPPTLTIRDNLAEKIKNSIALNNSNEVDNNFKSFQSLNIIPLRETHISSSNDFDVQKPSWLEPTIVTPELPRKIIIDNDDENENDDFSDFQMVLPNNSEHIQSSSIPINNIIKEEKPVENRVDDDEFTDFHSSTPATVTPLQPTILPMEPLKPSINYDISSSVTKHVPTQINWPDPGVTDDDIKNIELNYTRHQPLSIEEHKKENSSVIDDEWSDFVSVPTTTNHLLKVTTERTSTPDLPLSVLNLSNVQPNKPPIPVITPTGLVQTRLSSNVQPELRNVVQTTIQPCQSLYNQSTVSLRPSIISNQFASAKNLSGGFNNNINIIGGSHDDDDDDWSDFVSSQPATTTSNGFQQKSFNLSNSFTTPTNIITNPGHFDSFQNYVPHRSMQQVKNKLVPNVSSIPDLDFIAPRNRTSIKK